MLPGSRHICKWSNRQRDQYHTKLQADIRNIQDHIVGLSAKQQSILDISDSLTYVFRSVRIKQRSDLDLINGDIEASKFSLASKEFELQYYSDLKLFDMVLGGRKKMYTEEMTRDLWEMLIKALRFEEEIQVQKDEVVRLSRDFSEDTFWKLRSRMWLMGFKAKRSVKGVRSEVRKGERIVGGKEK